MGVVAIPLLIAASVGEAVSKVATGEVEARDQTAALRARADQEKLAATNDKLHRGEQLERTVSAATAEQAARGVSVESPSFEAIQSKSFDDFASDERTTDLNLKFQEDAINQQISNINKVNVFNDIGTLFGAAAQVGGAVSGGSGATSPATDPNAVTPGLDQGSSSLVKQAFKKSTTPFDFGKPKSGEFKDAFSYDPENLFRF